MAKDDLTAAVPSWGAELERERIATHEAGHAAMLVRHGEVIQSLSCDELHDYGAHVQGDGSGRKFAERASVLAAGRQVLTLEYPSESDAFWTRGSDVDFEQLSQAIEAFWKLHRVLGESDLKKAVQDLNNEARRISTEASSVIVDPEALDLSGQLMQEPTCDDLLTLSYFVATTLATSILMSSGMKRAVAHAKERLLEEGTIADTITLTHELRNLIFNEN